MVRRCVVGGSAQWLMPRREKRWLASGWRPRPRVVSKGPTSIQRFSRFVSLAVACDKRTASAPAAQAHVKSKVRTKSHAWPRRAPQSGFVVLELVRHAIALHEQPSILHGPAVAVDGQVAAHNGSPSSRGWNLRRWQRRNKAERRDHRRRGGRESRQCAINRRHAFRPRFSQDFRASSR